MMTAESPPKETQPGKTKLGRFSWTSFGQRHVPRNLVFVINAGSTEGGASTVPHAMLSPGYDTL